MKTIICLVLTLSSFTALSFENAGRFGLGATLQTYNQMPAVSLKVHFNEKTAVGTYLAYEGTDEANYNFGFRYYNSILSEPNLLFYAVLSGGILQVYDGTTATSGYDASVHIGSEIFFEEIKHIGLSFEAGLSVTSLDEFVFKTSASHLFQSAVHFYF